MWYTYSKRNKDKSKSPLNWWEAVPGHLHVLRDGKKDTGFSVYHTNKLDKKRVPKPYFDVRKNDKKIGGDHDLSKAKEQTEIKYQEA